MAYASSLRDEQLCDDLSARVSNVEPEDFWRKPFDIAALAEVGILRHDGETRTASELPQIVIDMAIEADVPHVNAARKAGGNQRDQSRAEILVEE